MFKRLGIETPLQFAITICVLTLILVTPLGGSGGAPWVFFVYRTLLVVITLLCAISARREDLKIAPGFLMLVAIDILLMLVSTLRIPGSHFEGLYLWYKHAFFVCAFLSLAFYSRYQAARWRGLLLGTVVFGNVIHLMPDLLRHRVVVSSFSNNANYFATFLLIGMAVCVAVVVFGTGIALRVTAGGVGALLLFGITQTWSRGATLAALFLGLVAAVRAGNRIPRHVWLFIGLVAMVMVIVASPFLVGKFLDRGERDPYNYARTKIWMNSLQIIAQYPILGAGFGQYFNVSKRFAFPVEGPVARYLKRAQIAHSEYLQWAGEVGIPATVLLLSLLSYLMYLAWRRAKTCWPEYRVFQEAALLTVAGVGTHALVDNCWTIPVSASSLVVLATADLLPLRKKEARSRKPEGRRFRLLAPGFWLLVVVIYVYSTMYPAIGLYYNDAGHKAFDRADFETAERMHLKAVAVVPDQPLFLDNLGMVYLQQFADTKDDRMLDLARIYFRRSITASHQSLDPHIHMETVLIRTLTGDRERDLETHRQIVENDSELLQIDPYIPFTRKNLAEALYQLGERERAFKEVQKAIVYEPNYVPGYLQLAAWSAESGNSAESQRYTDQAIAIITKHRDFKPQEAYEGILLGRPEASWIHTTRKN